MEKRRTFAEIERAMSLLMDVDEAELTPQERQDREEYLDVLRSMEAEKVDNFARFIRAQTAQADHLRAESARLAKKARSLESNIRWLKGQYLAVMQSRGLDMVRGEAYSVRRKRNKYVLITDEAALDPDYVRVDVKTIPDKRLIAAAIENGVQVDGAVLGESETLLLG